MAIRILKFLGLFSVSALAACTSGVDSTTGLTGTVHGGQSPIVGSTVTLYAAGDRFAKATSIASTTTDSRGNFQFTSASCPALESQLYVTAIGGNPGGGVNTAIHMMAVLGACSSLSGNSIVVNELTTVAAAYSANRFIGPSGCVDCDGGLPTSIDNISGPSPGLDNAMSMPARLVSTSTGQLSSLPNAQACSATSPPVNCLTSRKLNTLANALAACVNSSGPGSSQCLQLFACATPGATFSSNNTTICTVPAGAVQPTDMLQALLSIARNPVRISPIGIDYTASRNAVFTPAVNVHPTDYTLSINIVGGGLSKPYAIAIDAFGDVWTANLNGDTISEFDPSGLPLSPGAGFSGGGLNTPEGIAIDGLGNVWVSNAGNNSLSKFSAYGTALSPNPAGYTGGGLNGPRLLAIDTFGNVWVPNYDGVSISEFNASGVAVSPVNTGFTGGGLNNPPALAIDVSGNVWAVNSNSTISELDGRGVPLSSSGGFTGGGLNFPNAIAIDATGNVWASNFNGGSISELSSSGVALSPANTGFVNGGLTFPFGTAIDASGNVWVANDGGTSISEFSSTGVALSPAVGFTGGGLNTPTGIAVDASGNVWATNFQSANSITKFIGAAAPTRTPLVAKLKSGFAP